MIERPESVEVHVVHSPAADCFTISVVKAGEVIFSREISEIDWMRMGEPNVAELVNWSVVRQRHPELWEK